MASLDNVQNREWVIAYFAALTAVTLGLWIIRAASRYHQGTAGFDFDDVFIALSWLTSATMTALTIVGIVKYHFDRHLAGLAPDIATSAFEYAWVLNTLSLAQTAFTKISILLFYRRLDQGDYPPRFKWAIWVLISLIAIYSLVIFIIYVSNCDPVNAAWMQYDPHWASAKQHHCASRSEHIGTAWAAGLLAAVTDVLTVLLPPWTLAHIRLSHRVRTALTALFALGLLLVIPSIFRLVYLVRAEQQNADKLWNTYAALIAVKTEGDIGICLACAPALYTFVERCMSHHRERDRDSSTHTGSQSGNREPNHTHRSFRSTGSILSGQSARSAYLGNTVLSTGDSLRLGLEVPQVLKWSEKSMDNIPEAYSENLMGQQSIEKDIELSTTGAYAIKPPFRPATAESWLNLDTESSDEEHSPRAKPRPGNFPRQSPLR